MVRGGEAWDWAPGVVVRNYTQKSGDAHSGSTGTALAIPVKVSLYNDKSITDHLSDLVVATCRR